MTDKLLFCGSTLILAATLAASPAASAEPVAPAGLKANVNGLIVDLSWEWGNSGNRLLFESFEDETFPPAGWDLERGYVMGESGNWQRYTFAPEDEMPLTHSGLSTAMLLMAEEFDEEDPTTLHQDEWLIVKPGNGATYMDFWYYIHPELLSVGGYPDFPDHYYVKISRDGGDSWTELWDARWDMGNADEMQQASLFLGDPADDDTIVAFNAVSAEEESLFFLWAVDDVEFYDATGEPQAGINASTREHRAPALPAGVRTHRSFDVKPSMRKTARIPQNEWLNAGQTTYRVYLDDKIVGDYLKTRHFSDVSNKEKGSHTYRVMAWNEAEDKEYAAAETCVTIDEFTFLPPRNVIGLWKEQEGGKYQIEVGWELPVENPDENSFLPAYYVVYVNDKMFAQVDLTEELYAAGQHGLARGAYKLSVEAVYQIPEGTSERVDVYVFPGTVPSPVNLMAETKNNGYQLSWQLPEVPGFDEKPLDYAIYRGDEMIGQSDGELTFYDDQALDGFYLYSVHAVYEDGTFSLPATALIDRGTVKATLPIEEGFNEGHLPMNWQIDFVDPYQRVKEMYSWRFDNWFELEVPEGAGIDEGFASISSLAAGFNLLESYLMTPLFDIPADGTTKLTFDRWFFEDEVGPSGPALCGVQITVDGGENWNQLADLNSTDTGSLTVSLDEYKGKEARVRWGLKARMSGLLAIDNVKVTHTGLGAVEQLEITGDTRVDVISASGIVLRRDVKAADLQDLPKGTYLLRSLHGVKKIMVK